MVGLLEETKGRFLLGSQLLFWVLSNGDLSSLDGYYLSVLVISSIPGVGNCR